MQKWEIITPPARGIMRISSPKGVFMLPKGRKPNGLRAGNIAWALGLEV